MTNAFGGFLHTSPLSNLSSSTSHPPDLHSALASNCIRDYFGPVEQTVADSLHARGPSTLHDLISNIKLHCLKDWNEERGRLVDRLNKLIVAKKTAVATKMSMMMFLKKKYPQNYSTITEGHQSQ